MGRRTSARKGKKFAINSNVKSNATSRHSKRRGKGSSTKSNDVFSDDEEEAAHQERTMNARADVNEVFEYEGPTFDQEDSEVDEDEAFNSEDEAAYGLFFDRTKGKEEEEEGEEEKEGEEEEEGDLLSDLLGTTPAARLVIISEEEEEEEKIKNLSKMVDTLVEHKSSKKLVEIDSQFANEAVDGELTLSNLLGARMAKPGAEAAEKDNEEAQEKTKIGLDLRRMRQQVRELEGDGTMLTLQANREPKETLDLRVQAPKLEKLTPAALASKFVAQTDMEKSVAALLEAGDLSDKKQAKGEEEELARKHVSTEEVAARQKELAKLRSLLFYEEQKKKRIKKIKSKLYHKIRNAQDKKAVARQKEELRALDPELARKLDEELAEKRAEERLTLKHRNTSKWVKHQLRRGIQADDATRSAIADQLRRGEELRRKINTVHSDDDDMDDDEDNCEDDAASRLQTRLERQANALVSEIDADSEEAGKKRGLQGMKFMQRAAEKQREEARVEAEKLLREIRTGDGADGDRILSEGEDYLSSGDEGFAAKKIKRAKKLKKKVVVTEANKVAIDRALARGALQTTNVSMCGGVSAHTSGMVAVDLGEGGSSVTLLNGDKKQSKELELGAKILDQKVTIAASEPQSKVESAEDADMKPATEGEKTPGEPEHTVSGNNKKKKNKKTQKNAQHAGQDELVRRAFEFVADEEDVLAQEKDRLVGRDADEEGYRDCEAREYVWMGSWAGDGALAGRKDARLDKVLINEKKDKKAAKFKVKDVPYPFTSRAEYEAVMRNPLGSDWNTSQVTNVLTAPKIMKHAGTTIAPLMLTKEDRKQAKKELSLKRKAKF
ncbi:unnamed protein product [Peronospora destructor]|uniref:U3 small nucleolar RNA-associated protein 14 n=1 Tax=Peronospora destructor TaxID=86335 RepID=A0AAV0V911_9STRA|nr:unnamed protein product [Peronospora destructor]